MLTWQGRIKTKLVSEPIQKKSGNGTYQTVTLVGEDNFSIDTYLNEQTASLNNGDSAQIMYQTVQKKDGNFYKKYLNMLKIDNQASPAPQLNGSMEQNTTASQYKTPNQLPNPTFRPAPQKNSASWSQKPKNTYDAKGQMKGNSVSNSVSLVSAATKLAIARKTLDVNGLSLALDDLTNLTKTKGLQSAMEIVNIHKSLEDLD